MQPETASARRWAAPAVGWLALSAGLWTLGRTNYLLFHSLVETFSIVIAFSVFAIAWNTRRLIGNGYLLFLGLTSLFVGGIDLLHTLAYRGMGVFPGAGPDLATQLWVAARGLQALSLLAAPAFLDRSPRPPWVLGAGALLAGGLVAAVFTGRFPACFVEGQGLTRFKVLAEYAVIGAVGAAALLLRRRRSEFEGGVYRTLLLFLAATVGAEAAFTLYHDVYGVANFIGHLFKLLAFYLLYRALVATGLARPFELLFRNLKRGEDTLREENRRLTELKRELEEKNRALSAAMEQKNELLGVAAHDVRSPLAVIEMYGSLLAERLAGGDADALHFLDIMRRTTQRILVLVSDLLDLSTIESGRLRLEPRAVDLRPLIEQHLEEHRALAEGRGVRVRLDADPGVPPALADPLRIGQVLTNLLVNACKFSPPGAAVEIRLFSSGGQVAVAVGDEGPGIPPEDLERIFLPFTPAQPRPAGGERSTGLGLAIVHKIIQEHGGRVTVSSSPGGGSLFTFFLPPADAPRDAGRGGG